MYVSKELLKVLYCPFTKNRLIYDREKEELVSAAAKVSFPIMDGVPILLKEAAKPVNPERLQDLINKDKLERENAPSEPDYKEIGQAYEPKVKEKCL